jgi:NAD(P)H-flavin reductase
MGKDQEQFIKQWAEMEEFLHEAVSYECLDFCENLFLYAHSVDDIKDGDFENIKKEDFEIFLLPVTAWHNNSFYLQNKVDLDILQRYTAYSWELSNLTSNDCVRRVLKCGVLTMIGFIINSHCKKGEIKSGFNNIINEIISENTLKD